MDKDVLKAKELCEKIHSNAFYILGGKKVPYYEHCFMVAKFIETYAEKDIDFDYAYKLAYLHDSIEDTEITYDYLLDNFGKDVADGVFALTKNKEVPYENQIADSVSRIVNLGKREVAITKMADRCCNLLEVLDTWSNEKYEKYICDAELILENLKVFSKGLSDFLQQKIDNAKQKLSMKKDKSLS